jgi:aspartyl-tRNA(Asn)/glutamyl-tRNA(Gln) amidotransferase subunit C
MATHQLDIHRVATLSRLELTAEEAERYAGQLHRILDHMDTLAKLDLSGIEPSAHAMPVYDVTRPDLAADGFSQQQALSNAPKAALDQFQIPKVIE